MPSHERELEDYILQGMAHAIWSHAFIQWAANVEPPPELPPNSDWTDVTPPTPPGAMAAAKDFAHGIREFNNLRLYPMAQMFLATRRYAQPRRSSVRTTEADQAFQFGEEVAMSCLGTLEVPEIAQYKLPQMKAMLDDDGQALSWDEGWTWAGRPEPTDNPQWPASSVQSLMFDSHRYTDKQAKRWAQDHGFKYGSFETSANYHRLRQFDPGYGQPCRTIEFGHGIKAIVCATRNPSGQPLGIEILVMEDDPKIQTRLARMLKQMLTNPHMIFADNVGAAIADLEVHEFGLVISDLSVLGSRSGLDLFEHIKTHYPQLVDHFVFFTDDERAQRAHYRYLQKGGATTEDLKRVIRAPTPGQATRAATQMPLDAFASTVLAHAQRIRRTDDPQGRAIGRYGHKVFVAALWRDLSHDPRIQAMGLSGFKRSLWESHRAGLLELARADLVGAMNDTEVVQSEIAQGNATFHFVVDPKSLPAAVTPVPAFVAPRLDDFSQIVLQALPGIRQHIGASGRPAGRFGDDKVFIAAVWRQIKGDPRLGGMTMDQFKRNLIRAQRNRMLNLARADLVGAMDGAEVAQSEIEDLGASFHFVLDPNARSSY